MLWLIMYEVHQEEVWTNWLRRLSGTAHEDIQCDEVIRKCYQDHVLTTPAKSVYDEQGWFTFYVHSKPDAPDFPEGSIFAGRTIRNRIEVRLLAQMSTPIDTCGPSCTMHDKNGQCGPHSRAGCMHSSPRPAGGCFLQRRRHLSVFLQARKLEPQRATTVQGWLVLLLTQWDTHTLSQATRLLLKAARAGPLNQRCILA